MPVEFVRPFKLPRGPARAPKRKEPKGKQGGISSHIFLVLAAFWVLALFCALSIHNGKQSQPPSSTQSQPITLSISSLNPEIASNQSTLGEQTTGQPAITAWRGPIQPLSLNSSKTKTPVINRIPTTEPVVFVTIDDGWVQTKEQQDWLIKHHLPISLFLTNNGIKNDYGYFKKLQDAGMTIQDHTLSHPDLTRLDIDRQKHEICATADKYQSVFGRRPELLRPPYGDYNDDTKKAAASCGFKAIVLWHAVVGTGGEEVQFQTPSNHLQPGDIVLMHFKQGFAADAQALAEQIQKNHLQIGRLEDWLAY